MSKEYAAMQIYCNSYAKAGFRKSDVHLVLRTKASAGSIKGEKPENKD